MSPTVPECNIPMELFTQQVLVFPVVPMFVAVDTACTHVLRNSGMKFLGPTLVGRKRSVGSVHQLLPPLGIIDTG